MAGTMTVDGAGIYRMQHAMEDFGYQISEEEALEFQHIYRKHQRSLDISETMEKILDLVQSRGIAMGILTNGDTGHQMEKIHGMHLEKWFSDDRIFVSDAIGYFKPDVRTFRAVEDALHLVPEETWYIGDPLKMTSKAPAAPAGMPSSSIAGITTRRLSGTNRIISWRARKNCLSCWNGYCRRSGRL